MKQANQPPKPQSRTNTEVSMSNRSRVFFPLMAIVGVLTLSGAAFVAWATHVLWIVDKLSSDTGATTGQMVLGGLGAFMPPVGVLHGLVIWFS